MGATTDSRRAVADAQLLTSTVEQLSTADSLEAITGIVASAVRQLMDADGATFVLRDDGKCFYADEDAISPMWKGLRFPMTACVSGWAMLHKEVVTIPDIYADERVPHDAYRPTFVQSMTMAPIRKDDPIGALGSYWADNRTPTDEEIRLLEVLANSAAVALENLELRGTIQRRSSERDDLAMRTDELEAAIHTLAHDLRSPLGAMLGYAELLQEGATDPDTAKVFSTTIVEAGQRMAEQIDRMLGLYRVTSTTMETSVVDLTALARKLAADLTVGAAGQRITITVADGLSATADPVLVHLLLENLMANAVKYSGKVDQARIEVGAGNDQGSLREFFVRDNGAGFDSESAGLLFRPLTRLHSENDFQGTGLGLASVARIVENHGGTVRAEGAVGEGACFWFTLPA